MHGAAPQQVKMQVIDRLAAVVARVDDDAVAVRESCFAGDLCGDGQQMPQQALVAAAGVRERGDVLARKDQQVGRRLGADVREGVGRVVLVNQLSRGSHRQ